MKRFIHLIVVATILTLLPLTTYISQKLNANAIYQVKVKDIINKMTQKEADSTKTLNVRLVIRNRINNGLKNLAKLLANKPYKEKQFWKKCDTTCRNIISSLDLPIAIGAVVKFQKSYSLKYYGENRNTSLLLKDLAKVTGITDLDNTHSTNEVNRHYIDPILKGTISSRIRKAFNTSIDFMSVRNRTEEYEVAYERQKNSLREIVLAKIDDKLLLLANIDLSNVNKKYSVQYKIKHWNDSNYDLCFINKKNRNCFYSNKIQANSNILNWVKKSPSTYSSKPSQFYVNNHILKLVDYPHSDFKHILIRKLPQKPVVFNKRNMFFITLLSFISCIIFKLYAEKLFLQRGPDISLQLIVFCGFVLIVLVPLSSLSYLSSQYSLLKFSNTKSNIESALDAKLQKYDRKVLRQYRNRLNMLRSFNSINKIAQYSKSSPNISLHKIAPNFLKTLENTYKKQPCSEIWFYTKKLGIAYYLYKLRQKSFIYQDPPEYFEIILKSRFDRILNIKSNEDHSKIDENQLKKEIAKDILLSMFGHKAYYRLNDPYDNYIKLVAKNNDRSMMMVRIRFQGKVIGVICWMHGSASSSYGNLPDIEQSDPLIVLSGNKSPYFTRPQNYNYYLKTMPNVLKAGEDNRFFKCTIQKELNLGTQTTVIEAISAKNANITIAGKMIMPNFQEIQKTISKVVSRKATLLVILALILAILSAWYFTSPIRTLTKAVKSITTQDYSVRLNTEQPDEFGTIFTNFNSIAKGLEEGKLIKKFVSTSIEEEIKKDTNIIYSTNAQIKQTTILFSGIVSFDKILNENDPKKIFQTLQKHLSASVKAIKGINGEIDKMIEDKIMIVFESEHHALDAIIAAKTIKKELEKSNIKVGIGINSGNVVSGIMGASEVRLAKTVIGDPVNLSARLASLAIKNKNSSIIISGKTLQKLPSSFKAKKLEIDKVKGKTQTIEAYLLNESEI